MEYGIDFCRVYDLFGWNYYPEIFGEQLLQWLELHALSPKTCLDIGCGTGVLCRLLTEHGFRTLGIDLSDGMIDVARSHDPVLDYRVADMTEFVSNEPFELVTCTGDAINHIGNPDRVLRVFRNVYNSLTDGGIFVLDALSGREAGDGEPFELEYSDTVRAGFRITREDETRIRLNVRVFENDLLRFEEVIHETLYSPDLLTSLLKEAGFSDAYCSDRFPETAPISGTTLYFTARRFG